MLRKVGGFFAGLIIALALVQVAELGVHAMHPPPPGTTMKDFAEVKRYVGALPVAPLLLVLAGWLAGTFAGTFAAARIGRSASPGYFLAGILFGVGVVNSILIPQPVWFSISAFIIYVLAGGEGTRLGARAAAAASVRAPASSEIE